VGNFEELTWVQAHEKATRGLVVLLPVGSTEAHGPHLPLATDVIISREMSRRSVLKLKDQGIDAAIMPAISYSVTDFSSDFSGTVSIRKETAIALISDVCVAMYQQGARLVAIANSHLEPDHVASIESAIEVVKQRTGKLVAFPDKRRRRWARTLTEEFQRGDCHAGSYETSLVMVARPDLVREEIRQTLQRVPISIADKIKTGARSFREAGGTEAYFGDPGAASVEEGEASYEALSDMMVTAVLEALGQSTTQE